MNTANARCTSIGGMSIDSLGIFQDRLKQMALAQPKRLRTDHFAGRFATVLRTALNLSACAPASSVANAMPFAALELNAGFEECFPVGTSDPRFDRRTTLPTPDAMLRAILRAETPDELKSAAALAAELRSKREDAIARRAYTDRSASLRAEAALSMQWDSRCESRLRERIEAVRQTDELVEARLPICFFTSAQHRAERADTCDAQPKRPGV